MTGVHPALLPDAAYGPLGRLRLRVDGAGPEMITLSRGVFAPAGMHSW